MRKVYCPKNIKKFCFKIFKQVTELSSFFICLANEKLHQALLTYRHNGFFSLCSEKDFSIHSLTLSLFPYSSWTYKATSIHEHKSKENTMLQPELTLITHKMSI